MKTLSLLLLGFAIGIATTSGCSNDTSPKVIRGDADELAKLKAEEA